MKSRIRLSTITFISVLLLLATGCSAQDASEQGAMTITDDANRTIIIEGKVERIISLAPSNTEMLFALGLGERVVGVSKYCNYPAEAADIDKIGTLRELDYEKIIELAPDVILGGGLTSEEDIAKMEEIGLSVVVLAASDLDGVFANIELVGKLTGVEKEAERLVTQLRTKLDNLLAKIETVSHKPRVFLEISSSLYTVAPDTFMGAFVDLAGGVNIAADSETSWPQFSAEEIIERDPEVIILADTDIEVTAEMVKTRPGWENITAIKNDAVHNINADIITRPGPRMIDGLEVLTRMIHPELFD